MTAPETIEKTLETAKNAVKTVLPLPWALWFWKQARKIVVLVVGSTVVLAGVAMLVLPGPGWLTIFAGLAVLATEFAWAGWVLKHARERVGLLIKYAQEQLPGNHRPPRE